MIGVGVALIVLGVVFLFLVPWVGIVAGVVGLVLAFLWLVGFGRRAVTSGDDTLGRNPTRDRIGHDQV
jgi:predicted anti-sigma-YlaC factor YlaD